MRYFILSGGLGTRARPLSYYLPKPLFPLNGTPIIELLINQLTETLSGDGIVNLHYKGDIIKNHLNSKYRVDYIDEPVLSGSSILQQALPHFDEWLFIVNGDVYMELPVSNMIKQLEMSGAEGILLTRPLENAGYPALIFEKNQFVRRNMSSGIGAPMYTGAAILHRRVIEKIDSMNFFETLENNKFRIVSMTYQGLWLDLGSPESYFRAERKYSSKTEENSVSENVQISEEADITGSIIWPGCRIESGAVIRNSIITADKVSGSCNLSNSIITDSRVYPLDI